MPHHEDDDIAPDAIREQRRMKSTLLPGDNNSDVNAIAAREKNAMDRLQESIMAWAEEKGWNQGLDERSFGDWCSLVTTEVSEAYEDYREHRKLDEIYYEFQGETSSTTTHGEKLTHDEMWDMIRVDGYELSLFKPCGIPIEFADAVIRILHLAEFAGFNLFNMIEMKMDYNRRREFRHGNKKV